jgi:NADP-dependent 3-hydroxy acid dehydrogenase YdfG
MKDLILITGSSSGFGALTARALAQAGYVVYASMIGIHGHNAPQVAALRAFAVEHKVDLRAVDWT